MLKGVITVGGWTMASRVLGFVRDMIFAAVLGAGPVADAFFVALRLPNLFRRLFGEGAFNAAFVPDFSGILTTEGRPAARRFAEEAFSVMTFWLLLLTVVGEIFMPQLMLLLAPGFRSDPTKFALAITLSRITFPYLLLICLTALVGGVLNGLHHFAAAALAPVVYNLISIAFMLYLTPYVPTVGHAFAIGVSVSGVAQLGLLLWAVKRAGMGMRLPRPRLTPQMRHLVRRMIPGLIGAGVMQINQMVDMVVLSLLPSGSYALIYYANQVQQLPLAIIGTAVGTALLPTLSRHVRANETAQASHSMNRALEYALFLTLPATVALMVIPTPIISALFQRGAFNVADAHLSAQALVAYALGLPAFVLVKVLAPGFFARGDTATPVRIGMACVILNFALNLALMGPLRHIGPPLATSLAAWVNFAAMGLILRKRGQLTLDALVHRRVPRVLAAAGLMGMALWLITPRLWAAMDHPHGLRYVGISLLVGLGGSLYLVAAVGLRGVDLGGLKQRLLRRRSAA